MSLVDVFGKEDRTEVKFSEFFALVKQAAQYETLMNAVNCDVPHRFIRETMTGKKEEVPEIPEKKEAVLGVVKVDFDAEEFRKTLQEATAEIKAKFGPEEDEAEQEQEAPVKEPPEITAESILAAAEETTLEAAEETTCRGKKGERNMVAVGIICFIAGAVAATVGLVAFGVHLANQNKQ